MNKDKYRYKYELMVDRISAILCCICNGDYCKHCYKFYLPFFLKKILCGKCNAFSSVIDDLHALLNNDDSDKHLVEELLNKIIDLEEEIKRLKEKSNG